jgi:putative glutamine amidotransferase
MSAPRILISGRTREVKGAERTGVNASYVRSIVRCGGVPLIASPLAGAEAAAPMLEGADALLLSGGEDIDPATYGAARSGKLGEVDPRRDHFELALFRDAWSRGVPVLAVCRGLQLVNVALGGTLWQDLPSQAPGPVRHDQPAGRDDRTHSVHILPGSRLARALGVTTLSTNSFHHQAIRDLAPALSATARADEGVIEGVESAADAPWLVGVQWHPEEFHGARDAPDLGVFQALVEEGRRFRASALRASALDR